MAGSKTVQIVVPDQYERWIAGFQTMPVVMARAIESQWAIATDLLLDRSQDAIHVISGDLKTSGRADSRLEGTTVVGEVTYGGVMGTEGMVDYAMEEEDRGGEHAYLALGWSQAESAFSKAMPVAWSEVIAGWR